MDEDKIIEKLIEHEEVLQTIKENMFSKQDGRQMVEVLEGISTVCKKIQEDQVFSIE